MNDILPEGLEIVDLDGDEMKIRPVDHKPARAVLLLNVRDETDNAGVHLTEDDARILRNWLTRFLDSKSHK